MALGHESVRTVISSARLKTTLQAMGIQRYIFFSIHNAEKHPEVPLMQVKTCTEKFLEQSGLDYTIFRLCGFMQARPGSWLPAQ